MSVICIYDNHIKPNVFIKNIVGEKTFGEVILRRKSVREKFKAFISGIDCIDDILELDYGWQLDDLIKKMELLDQGTHVVHLFSNCVVKDEKAVKMILKKAPFINENYVWVSNKRSPVLFMMENLDEYCRFLRKHDLYLSDISVYNNDDRKFEQIETNAFFDLSVHSNFLQYISGGFDTRFFNSVKGDDFVVTKSSKDKQKIKSEFQFYKLLPDHMKMWFVMPYHYYEDGDFASYDMERYHMTDLAIRWVHGAIDIDEFKKLMIKVFHFIKTREKKTVGSEEYIQIQEALYIKKVDARIHTLKQHELYTVFHNFISYGTTYSDIDEIVQHYKRLYTIISENKPVDPVCVIGHGDLCFSNMLFNKEADLLKLIDPKGALEENQLWTDPYYDLAKLSHSICGRYDFFNNGLHHISLEGDLRFQLNINFDNSHYKYIFKKCIEDTGFSYLRVRIYECSLFLSMLPLHMDNPQKVFGFILNAVDLMEEIEECMKNCRW